jgi:hypothetical protein
MPLSWSLLKNVKFVLLTNYIRRFQSSTAVADVDSVSEFGYHVHTACITDV